MKEKLPKGEKERLVSYLPVEMVRRIHIAATASNKTQSKFMHDLFENYVREQDERRRVIAVLPD